MHTHENNADSQLTLDLNRQHYSDQCQRVLDLLLSGKRLTVRSATIEYDILSLPRRILDLKESGIAIKDEWIIEDGKRVAKEYYL